MSTDRNKIPDELIKVIKTLLNLIVLLVFALLLLPVLFYNSDSINKFFFAAPPSEKTTSADPAVVSAGAVPVSLYWKAADLNEINDAKKLEQISYGKDLIAHTAKYLGPNGSVLHISNGMNCQNCHLDAGTKVFGNNYGSVASMYPIFRARSGVVEDINKRVNDCVERSLNGKALDTAGNEMQAIKAYIEYVGSNVEKGKKAAGSGFKDLAFMDRACDTEKGSAVYKTKCMSCHQANGEGLLTAGASEFTYPPLWGKHSYNDGAGLYRITNFAKYVKYNMPFGVTHDNVQLSDEEAWDVAAFVNSQMHPHKNTPKDWPDISKKPVDHPFGPYADKFSEHQHKYGPYKPIAAEQKKREETAKQKETASAKK
nr:c-type cytochrome [Bacteroidota bacterium]